MRNNNITVLFTTLVLLICSCQATLGVDLSFFQGNVSVGTWQCLAQQGYQFAIVQATAGSSGRVNPYIADVLRNVRNAGIQFADIYVFLHYPNDAAGQIADVVNNIASQGASDLYGQIWVDVEAPSLWSSDCNTNVNYIQQAVNAIQGFGKVAAIYSSASQWGPIMCDSTQFSNLNLWYAHYDNWPSFGDFTSFGGWGKPNIKQYAGDQSVCGTGVDLDYY